MQHGRGPSARPRHTPQLFAKGSGEARSREAGDVSPLGRVTEAPPPRAGNLARAAFLSDLTELTRGALGAELWAGGAVVAFVPLT